MLDGTPSDIVERYQSLPELAEQADFGVLDRTVVVLDTETTGLSFSHDELIQIAAAKLDCGKIVDWYTTFVDPGKDLPEEITHLTGIKEQDLEGAPDPSEALEGLVEFVGDAAIVAHNAPFDKHFVTNHPAGYPLFENTWIDSLDLSRIALPRLKSHRLIDLVRAFDAPASTHRADDDVAATCVVYRILLAGVASMPHELVCAIASMAPREEWSTGFVFEHIADWQQGNCEAFSLREMRKKRIIELSSRPSRKDAGDPEVVLNHPSKEEISHAFTQEGALGRIYPDYEPREEQRIMALAIRDAFEMSDNLVVEAGTGVGKSMAYLVPAALFARENDVTVGVATKTNSLLDQLVYQELPSLAEALDGQLTWAPLKGMAHYPCLRKVNRVVENGPVVREIAGASISQAPSLAALLSFIEQSEFDDIDTLKIDYRALPRRQITTTSTECLRRKCPYYGRLCFVHGARRRAEQADIIVTNHSLLFCNIAADGGLLPPVRHWVVDEAHSTEDEARSAFAQTVDSEALLRLAGRVGSSAGVRNVFARAEKSLSGVEGEQITLLLGLVAKARSAGDAFARAADDYATSVKDLLYFDPVNKTKRGQSYEQVDVWINDEVRRNGVFGGVALNATALVEATDKLVKAAQDIVAYLEGIDEAAVAQREIASAAIELKDIRNALELIFQAAPETYAYQAALFRKKDRRADKVQALMLDVGDKLNEAFYSTTHSVVYTSATLTVGGRFDPFEQAVGLNREDFSHAKELELDSSYDFDNNMIIYVVKDMPEPNEPGYASALNRLLLEAHRAQKGSMLTLFTNRREMENCYNEVAPLLKADDLRVVCQKWGVSVKGLRDEFLSDEHLSLFALKSFWEGFDAPGATLKGVIIPKLPFGRPTDPLYCERASRDDRAWWRYVLPQAVIETKQAAGRLIRKADDRGVLILADKRLVTKRYGGTFLNSLQSRTVRVCDTDEIIAALRMMADWR